MAWTPPRHPQITNHFRHAEPLRAPHATRTMPAAPHVPRCSYGESQASGTGSGPGTQHRVDQRIGETSRRLIRGRACGFSCVSPGEVSCAMHSSPLAAAPAPGGELVNQWRGKSTAGPSHCRKSGCQNHCGAQHPVRRRQRYEAFVLIFVKTASGFYAIFVVVRLVPS